MDRKFPTLFNIEGYFFVKKYQSLKEQIFYLKCEKC